MLQIERRGFMMVLAGIALAPLPTIIARQRDDAPLVQRLIDQGIPVPSHTTYHIGQTIECAGRLAKITACTFLGLDGLAGPVINWSGSGDPLPGSYCTYNLLIGNLNHAAWTVA